MFKLSLNNSFEADVIAAILREERIPFTIVEHSSIPFDGLYQMTMGWGHLEVPEVDREKVVSLLEAFNESIRGSQV